MWGYEKPLFPRLHKCHHCKRRLDKTMPIIARSWFLGDGCTYDWFCSKECAKAEHDAEEAARERERKLNEEIER